VALRGFAVKDFVLHGERRRVAMSQFAVVHPDERGHHFMQVFAGQQREFISPHFDAVLAHFDEGNTAVITALVNSARRSIWSRKVHMLHFACVPSGDAGRPATSADAPRIASLLNAAHDGKVLFRTQDAASITSKLSVIPSYGFKDVLLSDRACVGMWLSGEAIEDTRAGVTTRRKLATVVDYGFDGAAGLEQLKALIDAWRTRCELAGITHLVLYTNEGAREAQSLMAHASHVDTFLMQCSLPEPPAGGPTVFTDPLFI